MYGVVNFNERTYIIPKASNLVQWDNEKEELTLTRDHFGVKPLYYSLFNGNLIFASEIKDILKFPGFPVEVDSQGISELFGIGPAHTARNLCI